MYGTKVQQVKFYLSASPLTLLAQYKFGLVYWNWWESAADWLQGLLFIHGSHNLHREMKAVNATWFLEIQSIKIPNVADFKCVQQEYKTDCFLLRAGNSEQCMKDKAPPSLMAVFKGSHNWIGWGFFSPVLIPCKAYRQCCFRYLRVLGIKPHENTISLNCFVSAAFRLSF